MKNSKKLAPVLSDSSTIIGNVRKLIEQTKIKIAATVNTELTQLCWEIGKRLQVEVMKGSRAEYGTEIISLVGRQMEIEFGRGFSEKSLRHMIRFAVIFDDENIVSALRRQFSWTHFKRFIYIDDPIKRSFYVEMCQLEGWSTRTLDKKIDSMLYERTALSVKPEKLAKEELKLLHDQGKLTPDLVFRDPYILDFLGLKDTFLEKDLEQAILRDMESFILELGVGFAFLERQKRIVVDNTDYYIVLLFYHRHLQCMIVIELKLGEFKPEHKGQMELYLSWLDKYERHTNEGSPLGLILCAGKKHETVELLNLEKSGIKVSQYWTEALPKELMEKKLHEAVNRARLKFAKNNLRRI